MAFTWKSHKAIFKGEGISHLTFAVSGRQPLLGRLLLLEAYAATYEHPEVIKRTDAELERKASERHQTYTPLPHLSKRWCMMAGNAMLDIITTTI